MVVRLVARSGKTDCDTPPLSTAGAAKPGALQQLFEAQPSAPPRPE